MKKASASPQSKRLETYRKLLLAKKAELVGSLGGTRFDMLAGMGRVAEEDQALLSHEEFISLQRNGIDYHKLRQVEAALERIDSGDYGICPECDEAISEKRLQVVPWAEYCIGCQDRVADLAGVERGHSEVPVEAHW